MRIARSRGALAGVMLVLLGLWGAAAPFIGPHIGFASSTDGATWTAERGWLQVLPGAATTLGGLVLAASRNRAIAMLGAWVSLAGGVWFIVGSAVADQLGLIDVKARSVTDGAGTWVELSRFAGVGALVVFFAAVSIGRMSVRSLRDIRRADAPVGIMESESTPPHESVDTHHVQQSPTDRAPDVGAGPAPRRRLTGLFGRRYASRE
jgi:hypothetical protein